MGSIYYVGGKIRELQSQRELLEKDIKDQRELFETKLQLVQSLSLRYEQLVQRPYEKLVISSSYTAMLLNIRHFSRRVWEPEPLSNLIRVISHILGEHKLLRTTQLANSILLYTSSESKDSCAL